MKTIINARNIILCVLHKTQYTYTQESAIKQKMKVATADVGDLSNKNIIKNKASRTVIVIATITFHGNGKMNDPRQNSLEFGPISLIIFSS